MTNAPIVKRALVDRIARDPAFSNRQVSLSHPGQEMEMESVFVNRTVAADRARSLGKTHRREVLTVELAIVSELHGNDFQEAEDRAWTMFNAIEQIILSDPSLDGKCLMSEITSFEQRGFSGDQIRACEITVQVEITADKDYDG